MKIVLRQENFCTRWPCCICGGLTEKNDVYALAENEDGSERGYICEFCMSAGPEGMKRRALYFAEEGIQVAAEHMEIARQFQEEPITGATWEEWCSREGMDPATAFQPQEPMVRGIGTGGFKLWLRDLMKDRPNVKGFG